jgi:hypothetical protein
MISPMEIWMVRMPGCYSSFVPGTHSSHFDHMIAPGAGDGSSGDRQLATRVITS